MNRKLTIAAAVFVGLLALFLLTRERGVKVGVRHLDLQSVVAADVVKIELGGAQQALLTKDGAAFVVADPAHPERRFVTDEALVKSALDALAQLRAGDFVSARPEKQAELELDDQKGLAVTISTATGPALDLVFGKSAQGGGNYVRRKGSDEIFVASGRLGSALRREVAGWRKKQLFDVKPEELASLLVKRPGGEGFGALADPPAEGAAAPTRQHWKLAEGTALPPGFRLDEEALGRIPASFAQLRAEAFAEEGVDEAKTGLADGVAVRLEATTRAGRKLGLALGGEDDKKRVYARVDGDATIYLVGGFAAKQLARPLSELRSLELLGFDPAKATRVTFHAPGQTAVVEKRGAAWSLVEPKQAPPGLELDPGTIAGQVAQLARLRASRLVEPPPAPAAAGLDKAAVRVEVVVDGKPRTLSLGNELPAATPGAPKETFARGALDALVYAIPAAARTRYEKPLELFRKVTPPPQPGGMQGLESLPPEVRRQLEEQLRSGNLPH